MVATGKYQLKDGRTVALRRAGPQDEPAIVALFTELSPESFRDRFHSGWVGPALISRLARVGPPTGTVCVVAAAPEDPDRLVAEARYVPMGTGLAELGITVLDDYQGTGLGKLLLGMLVQRAGESGLSRLRAVVSLTNTAMLRLLETYGWTLAEPTDFSVAYLEISATGGMPGWSARGTGRRVLVEQRSWFDNERVAALRAAGNDVRICAGPRARTGRACPLVTSGRCRLAEQADLIVTALPADQEDCAHVLDAHRQRWPDRLVG
ncbi:MAG TPA: GNAT family N-acetyltransferase [Streptosporangiaceae bacterium]|nr:GNAT family N-acetyltransferase [Streptosporangiaceae bacterium]